MKENGIKFKKLIAILFVALAVGNIFVLCGCSFGNVCMSTYNDAKYSIGSFDCNAATVDSIDVDWVVGDITIVQTEDEVLSVFEPDGLSNEMKLRWKIDGTTLYIKFWKSGYRARVESNKKALTLNVPQNLSTISVSSTSSDIKSSALEIGMAEFDSTSGMITLGTIDCSGKLEMDSTSGSVKADKVKADSLDIDTTSGIVNIDKIETNSVKIDTTSGAVKLGTVVCKGEVSMDCTSGSVRIADLDAYSLDCNTSSGNITVEKFKCNRAEFDTASGDVDITLANGVGATVDFSASSGKFKTNGTYTVNSNKKIIGDGACKIDFSSASGDLIIN